MSKTAEEWAKIFNRAQGTYGIIEVFRNDECTGGTTVIELDYCDVASSIKDLVKERDELKVKYQHAIGVLQAIQYNGHYGVCPLCRHSPGLGHSKYCELAAVLKEAEEPQ